MKSSIDQAAFGSITIEGVHDVLLRLTSQIEKRQKKTVRSGLWNVAYRIAGRGPTHVRDRGERPILGTGQDHTVVLSAEAAAYFQRRHSQVELFPTLKAILAWNRTSGSVIGRFHVTC